jgi:tRNA-splicing ligase RtcB (3'-phosphate/5'-hydroxy nucleic acid ligase)
MLKEKIDTDKILKQSGFDSSRDDYDEIAMTANQMINEAGISKDVAMEFIKKEFSRSENKLEKRESPVSITVYGEISRDIDQEAYDQLEEACRLPVAVAGALMPDAHVGYALPVGGVAALDNAVSPAFVGFDIACRMKLSILDISEDEFEANRKKLAKVLDDVTSFGMGSDFADGKRDHEVMEDERWKKIEIARELKDKAARQLGSSGSGNHFADLMTGRVLKEKDWLPLKKGDRFVALLTHSGSRGTGHQIATHFKEIAENETQKRSKGISENYSWLNLDEDSGREYWSAMQLMGKYSSANHELIHKHFSKESGIDIIASYENHHNFAWKKENMVIHRKGATPAEKGVVGIIPGSMGTASYIVEGLGEEKSLWSSAHGAGRISSRRQAKKNHDEAEYQQFIREKDIHTIGVTRDETYQCYKDIDRVMSIQEGKLSESVAEMYPRVVLMGGGRKSDDGD